jgi:O-antigen ligase
MQRWLLLIFLTTLALDWPQLPFTMRATDAAFIAVAIAVLAGIRTWARPRLQFLDLAVVIYLAGTLLALIFSPEPRAGANELVRHLYVATIYAIIALAVAQGLTRTIATGLALSGGVLAVLALIAAVVQSTTGYSFPKITPVMTLPYVGDIVRMQALTTSPAMFACVLAVSIPFAMRHPAIVAAPARGMAAAMILATAAALTFSHSIAGVAVAALIVCWNTWLSHRVLRIAAVTATILIVLAFNFAATVAIRSIGTTPLRDNTVFHYGVDSGRAEIAGVNVEYQTMSYLRIKQVAWDAFKSRPLFGIGPDRFHDITEAAYQQGRLTEPYRAIDPHSTFVGRLAETGLIGFVTLVVLWFAVVTAAIRLWKAPRQHQWIAIAAVAAIAGTLVNTMNADVMNFRYLWVVFGLVRGLSTTTPHAAS